MTLFICDDDKQISTELKALTNALNLKSLCFSSHIDLREALKTLPKPQAIVLDLVMPEGDGVAMLRELLNQHIPVIVLTSHKNEEAGLNAVRLGAKDYLTKPLNASRLEVALRFCLLQEEKLNFSPFLASSLRLTTLYAAAQKAMLDSAPVLIEGEKGTGKTTLALNLALHNERGFKNILEAKTLNPNTLIAAYTASPQGLLVIENMEHLTPETQVTLNSLIQKADKKAPKLLLTSGFSTFYLVQKGLMNEDLYYKLAIRPFALPNFKSERADFELLATHFHQLNRFGKTLQPNFDTLWQESAVSCAHSLKHAVSQAALLETMPHLVLFKDHDIRPLESLEREIYAAALHHYEGQMSEVARRLGVGRTTLYRKLEEYGLAPRLKIAA